MPKGFTISVVLPLTFLLALLFVFTGLFIQYSRAINHFLCSAPSNASGDIAWNVSSLPYYVVKKRLWTTDLHCGECEALGPAGSTSPAPPHRRSPLSCRLSLPNTERLISSDWQPCSHLALQSWCPRVSASRKAMVEVPLWLSLSFSQYPAPADRGWKVPTAALNYELHSAPAIYTTQHREPFPAEMPLAADYWGNISCTATSEVMVRRQSTWRSFCLQSLDWYERRGAGSW